MSKRKVLIPPHALEHVKEIVENNDPAALLFQKHIAKSERTAQEWVKAYREDSYRTFSSLGHVMTEPEDYDPSVELRNHVSLQQGRYIDLMKGFQDSHDDLYVAVTSDWHLPDHNPNALELARQVSHAWLSGRTNQLHLNNGDLWDFPTISRFNNNVPFWLLYPGCQSPGDYTLMTMHQTAIEQRSWNDVTPNHLLLTGNHDIRFIRYVFMAAPEIANWTVKSFMQQVEETGIIWMGNGVGRLVLERFKMLILHGFYARKGAGNSIRAQAEAESWFYDYYIQGHVHRWGNWSKARPDGSIVRGYEMGCIQNLQPLYTDNLMDWQHGMLLMRLPKNKFQEPEIHNLVFTERQLGKGRYLCASFDGIEIKEKIGTTYIAMRNKRRGIFNQDTLLTF